MANLAILEGSELGRPSIKRRVKRVVKTPKKVIKKVAKKTKRTAGNIKKAVKKITIDQAAKSVVSPIVSKYGKNLTEKKFLSIAAASLISSGVAIPLAPVGAKMAWKIYRTKFRDKTNTATGTTRAAAPVRSGLSPVSTSKKTELAKKVRVVPSPNLIPKGVSKKDTLKKSVSITAKPKKTFWQAVIDFFKGK